MKLGSSIALVFVAVASVEAFAIPPQHVAKYALHSRSYRIRPVRRQIEVGEKERQKETQQQEQKPQRQNGGGLTIGGLTLGGSSGGLNVGGLQLGGNQQGNAQQQEAAQQVRNETEVAGENAPAAEAEKPAAVEVQEPTADSKAPSGCQQQAVEVGAGAGTENQPGRAEGEAAKEEALQEAQQGGQGEAAQKEKSNGVKATEESEKFSEEIGITLDQAGNAQNLGGNLGITQGTDGSKSVGGENGINIAASGEATVAGNE